MLPTDATTFLSQILESPEDDTARLVFADWLREQSDPALRRRGEFLWAGVVAAKYRDAVEFPADYFDALREMNASAVGLPFWLEAIGLPVRYTDFKWDHNCDAVTATYGPERRVRFTRGMLSHIMLPTLEYLCVIPAVLAQCPLEEARITDHPGLSFAFRKSLGMWSVIGKFTARARARRRFGRAPEPPAQWGLTLSFPLRAQLIEGVESSSRTITTQLASRAGDRWIVRR